MSDILKFINDLNLYIKQDYNINMKEIHLFIEDSKIYNKLSDKDKILLDNIILLIQSSKTKDYRPASP